MILAKAEQEALGLLADEDDRTEVSIAGVEDPVLWLGMGYCVGKGWATYQGSYGFKITPAGRAAFADLAAE